MLPRGSHAAKTDTIKQRGVDVFLDPFDRKGRWTDIAEEQGDSLSKFVQKAVEYTIERGASASRAQHEQRQVLDERHSHFPR